MKYSNNTPVNVAYLDRDDTRAIVRKPEEKPAANAANKCFEAIAARRAHVLDLLNNLTPAARVELVNMLSKAVAYHKSGKIEGLFSLDVACSNCAFCQKMQEAGKSDPAIICGYCYTNSMFAAPRAAHEITGLILSNMALTPVEAAAVAIPGYMFRFDSDGEIINATHAANILQLVRTHPLTKFAIWTKRPGLLNPFILQDGKPDNLTIGISSVEINKPQENPFIWCDFVFTVYTPEGMKKALARGERECNGKKCRDCGFSCYMTGRTASGPVYVAEALRKPSRAKKETFDDIVRRIDAATL